MAWRIIVLSLLVLGLTAPPVTAQRQWAGPSQVFPIPEPPPGSSPEPIGSVRAVTRAAEGYAVTVQGGRWPYYPDLAPGLSAAALSDAGLLLDVSIANTSAVPMRYSAANFR